MVTGDEVPFFQTQEEQLAGEPVSQPDGPVQGINIKFEETDMSPYMNIEVSPDDGLYHCPQSGCGQKFTHRSPLRHVVRTSSLVPYHFANLL